jgi:hypothetical protein
VDEQQFLDKIKNKIERLTGNEIKLAVDSAEPGQLAVELGSSVPQVTLGSNVLQFSGFARMAVEYAVASIREGREISVLEFHILLARN